MDIHFTGEFLEQSGAPAPYDVLLGLQATLEWTVGGSLFYREELFSIAEFALPLKRWLASGLHKREPLEFTSIESDESPLIWVRPLTEGWTVGAHFAESPGEVAVEESDLSQALKSYVARVEETLRGLGLPPLQSLR